MRGSAIFSSAIFAYFCILFVSCNKAEPSKKIGCEDYINNSRSIVISYNTRRISPTVNPRNKSEIAFIQYNSKGNSSLCIYNEILNTKSTILENIVIFGQPIWSSDGNIYFINQNYSIIKLNPIDKSYSSIFGNVGIIAFLSISPNGQNLIFQIMSVPEIQSIIIDPNGNMIQENRTNNTTGNSIIYIAGSWLNDSLILSIDTNKGISVINVHSKKSSQLVELKTKTYNFEKIYSSKSGQYCFIVESNIGLWRIDLKSKEYVLVDKMCLFSEYGFISNYSKNEIILSQKNCSAYHYLDITCDEDLLIMDIISGKTRPLFK